jgi:hypothetical protein
VLSLFQTLGNLSGVNIKRHSDRLDHLLARCEQEIHEAEEKLRLLKTNRDNLKLMVNEPDKLTNVQPEPTRFRDTGITKSVLDAINDFWPLRKDAVTLTED